MEECPRIDGIQCMLNRCNVRIFFLRSTKGSRPVVQGHLQIAKASNVEEIAVLLVTIILRPFFNRKQAIAQLIALIGFVLQ